MFVLNKLTFKLNMGFNFVPAKPKQTLSASQQKISLNKLYRLPNKKFSLSTKIFKFFKLKRAEKNNSGQ